VSVGRPPPTLRRRLDNVWLRWQARLDAAWADRFLPWAVAVVLALVLGLLAVARARALGGGTDLATFLQASWLIRNGHDADLTLTGNHLLAEHLPVAFYPVAMATRWLPAMPLLLGLQATSLAFGVVPVWRLARRVASLRVGAAAAVVFAYALHPIVSGLDLSDFHPETLAVAPMLAATSYALQGRPRRFAALALLALLWNGDLGIVVAGLGVLLILEGRGRLGSWSIVGGLGYTSLALLVVQPRFGTAGLVAPGAFADYGSSALDVLISMVANPIRVVADVVAEPNLRVLVLLLAPLLFLPVLAPRYLLPAVGLQALYFVADVPESGVHAAPFAIPALVFCFVAAPFALARIGRRSIERVLVDPRVLVAMVVATVGFFAVDAGTSPYERPWNWSRDPTDEARVDAADLVDDDDAVRAATSMLALLAERRFVDVLETGAEPDPETAGRGVDVVVFDDELAPDWTIGDRVDFADGMAAQGFVLVYRSRGITVYELEP
jgi:uncharacterized membrane protein